MVLDADTQEYAIYNLMVIIELTLMYRGALY